MINDIDLTGKKYITVHKNSIHKKYYYERFSDSLNIEFEKAEIMKKVCDENGIVIAKPLATHHDKYTIVYEKITNYKRIKDHFIQTLSGRVSIDEGMKLQFLSGRALGAIHKNLKLSSKKIWHPNDTIAKTLKYMGKDKHKSVFSNTPEAYLHCDYGFANVAYRKLPNDEFQIVLFDPSPNRYITSNADNFGSIYVDISTYFSGLNGRIPLKFYKNANWSILPQLKNAFCEGYTSATDNTIDQYKAELIAYSFLSSLYTGAHMKEYKEDLTGVGLLPSLYDKAYIRKLLKYIKLKLIYNRFKGNEFWKK